MDQLSLDTLPLEIFHHIAYRLPPQAIWSLALVSKATNELIFADGAHLWKQLVLNRYDAPREWEGMDWKLMYQSRLWTEKLLRGHDFDVAWAIFGSTDPGDSWHPWKVLGKNLFAVLRDMTIENDVRNKSYLEPSKLVDFLRRQRHHSQLSATTVLFLSPISIYDPQLSTDVFAAAQKAVYAPTSFPLFDDQKTPNFNVFLCILKFFQHHLDYMRNHIRPGVRDALLNPGMPTASAFQPGPHVKRSDFDDDPSKIEGNWLGLYSYLGWADFEALRDNNPAVLEANRAGHLRDYLGGPQQVKIVLDQDCEYTPDDDPERVIRITGEGMNGGSFTLKGKLRKVFLPAEVAGQDKYLFWRVTFVKTYAQGENSWTRWIYDGIFCPGVGIIGRWRDGTEPPGTGVTGPFWLWKSKNMRPPVEIDSEDEQDSEFETPDVLSQAADDGSWVDSSGEEED